ncbi:hypothetical protein OBBRIDRAFT_114992 [Obba rivulosa]|uniref:Secreted protein n=1 Tax=Obba rivulosa TaxID=1052685 RepID=A0A8E2ANL2_9APHY|nr:hypothetical protein OBBRIDRAFT_114992 [Obba rivulosa]
MLVVFGGLACSLVFVLALNKQSDRRDGCNSFSRPSGSGLCCKNLKVLGYALALQKNLDQAQFSSSTCTRAREFCVIAFSISAIFWDRLFSYGLS